MARRRNDWWGAPIDFAALAIERSKKGWRPTPAQKAARLKRNAAKRKRARVEAGKRFAAKRTPTRRKGDGRALLAFLSAFEPGQWYGVADIANASGCKYNSCKAWVVTLRRKGWLERTKNPAFIRPGFLEPEWLYGITAMGRAEIERLRAQVQYHVEHQGEGAGDPEG